MAVDTRDKRGSAISISAPQRPILPNPDAGAEDLGDRQQVAYTYRGIAAAGGGGPAAVDDVYIRQFRRRRIR